MLWMLVDEGHSWRSWIYRTGDGGSAWGTPEQTPGMLPAARIVDGHNAWVQAEDGLWRTSDAGRTWLQRDLPPGWRCSQLVPGSATIAWCSATLGGFGPIALRTVLFGTHDGGINWEPRSLPADQPLNASEA
jgi:hypothetical protein